MTHIKVSQTNNHPLFLLFLSTIRLNRIYILNSIQHGNRIFLTVVHRVDLIWFVFLSIIPRSRIVWTSSPKIKV
jgi:tellurite resistance protein TehA-like permease